MNVRCYNRSSRLWLRFLHLTTKNKRRGWVNSSVASYSSKFFDDNVLFLVQFSFRLNGRLSMYYLATGPCMI